MKAVKSYCSCWVILMVTLLPFIAGCTPLSEKGPMTAGLLQPVTGRDLRIVTGQTVYVPAYSQIFYGQASRTMDLGVTLAIHNTDLNAPIIIRSVRYYNTDGLLVRSYINDPMSISPLATTGFLVEEGDVQGGWGANFIVEWIAEQPVYEPVIEAIMISTSGSQGISLLSTGRVISQTIQSITPSIESTDK